MGKIERLQRVFDKKTVVALKKLVDNPSVKKMSGELLLGIYRKSGRIGKKNNYVHSLFLTKDGLVEYLSQPYRQPFCRRKVKPSLKIIKRHFFNEEIINGIIVEIKD